jgi:hypothetical protein
MNIQPLRHQTRISLAAINHRPRARHDSRTGSYGSDGGGPNGRVLKNLKRFRAV